MPDFRGIPYYLLRPICIVRLSCYCLQQMLEKRNKLLFVAKKFKILCHKKHFFATWTRKIKLISEKVCEKIQIHFFDKVIHEKGPSIKDISRNFHFLRYPPFTCLLTSPFALRPPWGDVSPRLTPLPPISICSLSFCFEFVRPHKKYL